MKTTTKRVFSLFLTLVMALGLCSVSVFAEANTATITAKNVSGAVVGSGYSSLGAAAAAAGEYGTVEITAGYIYYDSRQGVSTDNVTITGAGRGATIITTSSTFANALPKNRKALETFTAENVTVENLTFDGGAYGRSIVPDSTEATQFNVVRVNSGSVHFDNVSIAGSTRTLLSIGTWGNTATSATVTAENFYCDGEYKTVTTANTYADISIVNGDFRLISGTVDAFICEDKDTNAGHFVNDCATTHHELKHTEKFLIWTLWTAYTTSTTKHFAECYTQMQSVSSSAKGKYAADLNDSDNDATTTKMVNDAISFIAAGDTDTADALLDALDYTKGEYPSNTFIAQEYTRLYNARYPSQS